MKRTYQPSVLVRKRRMDLGPGWQQLEVEELSAQDVQRVDLAFLRKIGVSDWLF